jgi:outer membrane protein OmpA-like peptidoglycan-associated protein/tetratricopeptide (TPR) repeat protein
MFTTFAANAQFIKDYRRNADNYYNNGDYKSAAQFYEKYLSDKKGPRGDKDEYNPYAVEATPAKKGAPAKPTVTTPPKGVSLRLINNRIAECYRLLNDYKAAEPWYAKVVADKATYPLSPYYHAVCLRALAKYQEAEAEFSSFLSDYKQDDEFSNNAKAELKNLKFIIAQMKGTQQKLFVVNKMPSDLNTTEHGQNTAPFVSNNTLYFTSSRPDTVIVKKQKLAKHTNDVYASKGGAKPEKAGLPVFKDMHQGSASFTPDGKTIFFTRWVSLSAKEAAIYKSTIGDNGTWTEPEKLGADVNAEGYTSKQPSITSDGKYLLYASNKPGGKGKFDIWYASLEGGKLGASANLGEPVNTADDEVTPFYHIPSKELVFATQGRVGMGGFDLFETKGTIGGSWAEPKNLGYPVNSQKDEQYFFSNDDKFLLKNFYISSDRGSDCCLELYTANKLIKKWIGGKVVDKNTGEAIANTSISVTNDKGQKLSPVTTDNNGNYFFETDPYNKLSASASKEKYEPSTESITADFNIDTLARADWKLTPIPPPPPPVITETKPLIVRFEFDSSNISTEFSVSLDSLAAMMARDKDMNVEIGGYTDQKGGDKYNINLSQKRADAAKAYLVAKYGTDASRLSTKAYGKCCPIEKEINEDGSDNPAARQTNRRLEFKWIKKAE